MTVFEVGVPGSIDTKVTSRTELPGRNRTTATWSASVAAPSSWTIASTTASGETERDRARMMRLKLSVSEWRRSASAPEARALMTADATRLGDRQSPGPGPPARRPAEEELDPGPPR
jgi:hypothetical protein